jgi:uncharacterized flavoprotein (TIGR03862 family)
MGNPATATAAVIGGGPAGLMAAEVLSAAGVAVTVHERMPTLGRKFLMAGRGGLNLTHSEPLERFLARYGAAAGRLRPLIEAFPPAALTAWAEGLDQPTFVGTSGRVFPKALKASPLLRAWTERLRGQGVTFRTRSPWLGWTDDGALRFEEGTERPDAVVLALGGASWPRLGSDGGWTTLLSDRGVALAPFRPANVGFAAAWSPTFRDRFAGEPLKSIALGFAGRTVRGEAMISRYGLEGGAVYALSAALRDAVERDGGAELLIDLKPDLSLEALAARLTGGRSGETLSNRLRKAGLAPAAVGLLREAHGITLPSEPARLAAAVKRAPLRLTGVQGLERAISSAGGVALSAVTDELELKALPGVFVAGEMLDWEAPTGGYLLQACFATGVAAARGALARLSPAPAAS